MHGYHARYRRHYHHDFCCGYHNYYDWCCNHRNYAYRDYYPRYYNRDCCY